MSNIQTGWVKPPTEIGGLDHLGVQAPCIQIYGQLLPGITNVTDRARYYSFYTWLLKKFDDHGWRTQEEIIDKLRKADCLFSLISIRHGLLSDNYSEHAGSAVGSNTLLPALESLGTDSVLVLSDFTHREEGKVDRYFKNPYGGLGQYYFGALWELKFLGGESVVSARVVKEAGVPLAKAMDAGNINGSLFIDVIERDEVSLKLLDQLSSFCHCQLKASEKEVNGIIRVLQTGSLTTEGEKLISLDDVNSAIIRSSSLALLIFLSSYSNGENQKLSVENFRGMVYSLSDYAGTQLNLTENLQKSARKWQVYQRNELLSIALQGLFFVLLKRADLSNIKFKNTSELCHWFWQQDLGVEIIKDTDPQTLENFINDNVDSLPSFNEWLHQDHEIQLMESVVRDTSRKSLTNIDLKKIAMNSLKILVAVLGRSENQFAYEYIEFRPDYLQLYPVNLLSVQEDLEQLKNTKVEDGLFRFTLKNCLDAHLHVAMRKLRQQGKNTSRFEISENGINIKSIPVATHTSPRFNQSIQILKDLGLLQVQGNAVMPSEKGKAFLEAVS
ncbi:MAG TPA: hypothetical protein EYG71_03455 [Leucothrix sp.]|nr:hypothetical protein [Leucothrix sp.]